MGPCAYPIAHRKHGGKLKIKTLVGAAALTVALGMMPSAPAYAAHGSSVATNAATASAKIPPRKIPGKITKRTAEIPISVDAGGGVSTAEVITCTLSASGWYAGSGHNYADGFVLCPVVHNLIAIDFQWYNYSTGAPLRYSGKLGCYDKATCGKADGLDSYALLSVFVCATTFIAGYTIGKTCLWVGPF